MADRKQIELDQLQARIVRADIEKAEAKEEYDKALKKQRDEEEKGRRISYELTPEEYEEFLEIIDSVTERLGLEEPIKRTTFLRMWSLYLKIQHNYIDFRLLYAEVRDIQSNNRSEGQLRKNNQLDYSFSVAPGASKIIS